MTPAMLQDALAAVVEQTLASLKLGSGGAFKVYTQDVPPRQEDGDLSIFPFAIVALGDGEDQGDIATQDVDVTLCVRDPDNDRQGHRDILNAVQRLREQFRKAPIIGGHFEVQSPIKWTVVAEKELHPFYYGGVLLTVSIPSISRTNPNI